MEKIYLFALIVSLSFCLFIYFYLSKQSKGSQLLRVMKIISILEIVHCSSMAMQIIFLNKVDPFIFEYFAYISGCFLPVAILFLGIIFAKTKITFKKYYVLLFIIPIISLILIWTNNYHHLFYINYSVELSETTIGLYAYIHSAYSYILMLIGLLYLIIYSIKNSSFFSKQSILMIIGCLIPLSINILGTFNIIPITIYLTPISFVIFTFFCAIAIFKFQFLSVAPIALQKIVDRMSDLYLVTNDTFKIIDFNKPFVEITHTNSSGLRNRDIFDLLVDNSDLFVTKEELNSSFVKVKTNPSKTIVLEKHSKSLNKYFNIEISSIVSNNNLLGILILFKDVTQHMEDMATIKNSQDILVERERLASLGQMIGGIAHNLKTPIMSISGAAEGLSDLIKEYDAAIGDVEVTEQDNHDIAHEMSGWVEKIRDYTGYMSDVITAVKGQAVSLSDEEAVSFSLEELVKRVNILMKHELKNAICYLNVSMKANPSTELNGNVNSLVQVINNMISNAIQSYNGVPEKNIDMTLYQENNNIIIAIKDYGPGLPDNVKEKLFKEMITTKGKNGTGLGLFMSYSNIRAHFNGNIKFESKKDKGTTFYIELPIQ